MSARIRTRFTAIALCGVLGLCLLGSSAGNAEASSKKEIQPPAHHEQVHPHKTGRDEKDRHEARRHPSGNGSGKSQHPERKQDTEAIVSAIVSHAAGKAT